MRKLLTTAALLLSLSCSAFAGEMHTPGAPTTPPDSAQAQSSTTATDTLTQIVLTVLVSVLP
jgi:hypothetical protein